MTAPNLLPSLGTTDKGPTQHVALAPAGPSPAADSICPRAHTKHNCPGPAPLSNCMHSGACSGAWPLRVAAHRSKSPPRASLPAPCENSRASRLCHDANFLDSSCRAASVFCQNYHGSTHKNPTLSFNRRGHSVFRFLFFCPTASPLRRQHRSTHRKCDCSSYPFRRGGPSCTPSA